MCLRGRFDRLANQSPVWTLASNPNTYEAPMRQQQTALSATKPEQMEADRPFHRCVSSFDVGGSVTPWCPLFASNKSLILSLVCVGCSSAIWSVEWFHIVNWCPPFLAGPNGRPPLRPPTNTRRNPIETSQTAINRIILLDDNVVDDWGKVGSCRLLVSLRFSSDACPLRQRVCPTHESMEASFSGIRCFWILKEACYEYDWSRWGLW